MAARAARRALCAAAVALLAAAPADALRRSERTVASAADAALSHPKEPKEPKEHHHHSHKHEKPGPLLPSAAAAPTPAGHCRAPEPGDKVVYFVRHGQKDIIAGGADPELSKMGRFQAGILKLQPELTAALSANASHRAQLLLISPLRRTLETAVLGFGGQFPPEQWLLSRDVMEQEIRDKPQVEKGEAMLRSMNAVNLLEQYQSLTANWSDEPGVTTSRGENAAQADRFAKFLRDRPEERFIVVTHHWFAENIGGHNLNEGQVGLSALTPGGEWRRLDPPACWPQFREQYVEIRAAVEAAIAAADAAKHAAADAAKHKK